MVHVTCQYVIKQDVVSFHRNQFVKLFNHDRSKNIEVSSLYPSTDNAQKLDNIHFISKNRNWIIFTLYPSTDKAQSFDDIHVVS